MSLNTDTRHALITGGGSGIGAAIAQRLSSEGMFVTVVGRRQQPLEALVSELPRAQWVCVDVTDPAAMRDAFKTAGNRFGPVNVAVANAGSASSAPFVRLDPEDVQSMLNVNVMGVFNTFQAGLPGMLEGGWGRLIAVASTAGMKGYPYVSHYCASKHAVVGLVRALAIELASKGVTVNAVCPSFVDTEMTERTLENIQSKTGLSKEAALQSLVSANPQARLISPDEVADSVERLCGVHAGAINGQALAIAGGEL